MSWIPIHVRLGSRTGAPAERAPNSSVWTFNVLVDGLGSCSPAPPAVRWPSRSSSSMISNPLSDDGALSPASSSVPGRLLSFRRAFNRFMSTSFCVRPQRRQFLAQ